MTFCQPDKEKQTDKEILDLEEAGWFCFALVSKTLIYFYFLM